MDIYNWAFPETTINADKEVNNDLDNLLKTDKNILNSNIKKDSSLIKISQLGDINLESPTKYLLNNQLGLLLLQLDSTKSNQTLFLRQDLTKN